MFHFVVLSATIRKIRDEAGLKNVFIAEGINGRLRLIGREGTRTAEDVASDLARPRLGPRRGRDLVFGTLIALTACATRVPDVDILAALLKRLDDEAGEEIRSAGIVYDWCKRAVSRGIFRTEPVLPNPETP